ncbi:hypothetical protein JTB14_035108 [Gonioctena quinquepunctata]|nr:hypothetical protein JTB14_035108 [Gonioctena quinquepunctata]
MKDNKCFKISMDYNLKDTAYSNTFWPCGVAVYQQFQKKGEIPGKDPKQHWGELKFSDRTSMGDTKLADSTKPQQKTTDDKESIGR